MKSIRLLWFGCVIVLFTGCVSVARRPYSKFTLPKESVETVKGKYYINEITSFKMNTESQKYSEGEAYGSEQELNVIKELINLHMNEKYPGFLGQSGNAMPIDLEISCVYDSNSTGRVLLSALTLGALIPVPIGNNSCLCNVKISPHGKNGNSCESTNMAYTHGSCGWLLNYVWLPLSAALSDFYICSNGELLLYANGMVSPEVVAAAICEFDANQSSAK